MKREKKGLDKKKPASSGQKITHLKDEEDSAIIVDVSSNSLMRLATPL